VNKVELRNDLPGAGIIDEYSPEQVKELSEKYGIRIITINALQHFNVNSLLPALLKELQELLRLSISIDCGAIVLCPHNNVKDGRSSEQCFKETVEALKEFAPFFAEHGLMGYVEPLGFEESSLRSLVTAMKAIQESGYEEHYRIVYDTFHHHIGPDSLESLGNEYDVSYTGLIHVSGVESEIPTSQYRDAHRLLIEAADKLKSREQIEKLVALGYEGAISFEPFAEDIQQMELEDLKTAINESIEYILGDEE
jgi:2-keto-myo-inositol isomerase